MLAAKIVRVQTIYDPAPPSEIPAELPALKIEDMPEAVLTGRLGDLCQRLLGDFPRAYSWPGIVTCAGVQIVGPRILQTNLDTGLVGPVGTGKSQVNDRSMLSVGMDPDGNVPPVMKLKAGSGEGLLKAIGDVMGASRLLAVDELGHLLEKAHLENSSFPYILNSTFYSARQKLRVARGQEIDFNCNLSILGCLLEDNFGDLFGKSTTSGLYDRFMFGYCPTGFSYSYRPFEGEPLKMEPRAVDVDFRVWAERDEWVKTIPGPTGRIAEIALRAAAICAAFDGKNTLMVSDLAPAKALVEYQVRIRKLLKPNPGENFEARAAFKILAYLQRHAPDGQWVKKRLMLKNTRVYELGPSIGNKAMQHLGYNGDIEEKTEGRQGFVRLICD